MMTPEEFFDKITHIVDDARTPDQSKEWSDTFFQAIQEYYRLKCLEAIRNTRYATIDICLEHVENENCTHDVISQIQRDIQNIPNQEVMPEL
mgnify:FL=1|jgi:hypothetical protein